ncbi:117_t:CDS:2 [Dentiscutata heterogama]|uniref:117_t:CDS:1 n=1 Tax=Dentiscutata heterogama TaxID=1316150 RepID=A0ACA9JY07_9GLOM|nr:117_t:CDS:2 [Dentiscutata heterogama]
MLPIKLNQITTETSSILNKDNNDLHQSAMNEFQWFCNDLKSLLNENDSTLDKSICKFIKVYKQHYLLKDTYI